MLSRSGRALVYTGVVLVGMLAFLVLAPGFLGGPGEAAASHYEDTQYEYAEGPNGVNEYVIRSYGNDPMNEQRAPEATERSWWSETIIHTVPEDEPLYLNTSVVYRPGSSGSCETSDLDEFGIDRGNDWEGERRTDTEVVSSLKDSYTEFGKYDEWREEHGEEYGPLIDPKVDASNVNLEKTVVVWYDREDAAGDPPRVEHGDRFVAAQGECWVNPAEPGWYRWASASSTEYENGTDRTQTHPDFSHWFWICDCENEQEAREKLGPPPHERDDSTPTPTETPDESTPTETPDESTPTETPDESTPDESTPEEATPEESTPDDSDTQTESTNEEQTEDGQQQQNVEGQEDATPSPGDGAGFGALAALVAVASTLIALRRRA